MSRNTLVLLLCSLVSIAHATITVGERHFQSMPAVFGKPFSIGGSYDTAHLQILEDNPFLCEPGLNSLNERHLKRGHKTANETNHILPPDGLPGTKNGVYYTCYTYHIILSLLYYSRGVGQSRSM